MWIWETALSKGYHSNRVTPLLEMEGGELGVYDQRAHALATALRASLSDPPTRAVAAIATRNANVAGVAPVAPVPAQSPQHTGITALAAAAQMRTTPRDSKFWCAEMRKQVDRKRAKRAEERERENSQMRQQYHLQVIQRRQEQAQSAADSAQVPVAGVGARPRADVVRYPADKAVDPVSTVETPAVRLGEERLPRVVNRRSIAGSTDKRELKRKTASRAASEANLRPVIDAAAAEVSKAIAAVDADELPPANAGSAIADSLVGVMGANAKTHLYLNYCQRLSQPTKQVRDLFGNTFNFNP